MANDNDEMLLSLIESPELRREIKNLARDLYEGANAMDSFTNGPFSDPEFRKEIGSLARWMYEAGNAIPRIDLAFSFTSDAEQVLCPDCGESITMHRQSSEVDKVLNHLFGHNWKIIQILEKAGNGTYLLGRAKTNKELLKQMLGDDLESSESEPKN